ncbi:hypothetical protein AFCDBAGC_4305 [Methylobacterium cerastii]|uniref:Uncharacterized protein n=1 Tax=Methylobacterium cerastii TaxID=932741 RepID=A0ABQ4QMK4_9HYPH|nr:hypothetical protein AFCDBAGC_4305 [Methylobacterium cerastii]
MATCSSNTHWQHHILPGPRGGARDPDTLVEPDFPASAVLDSGLAFGAPE